MLAITTIFLTCAHDRDKIMCMSPLLHCMRLPETSPVGLPWRCVCRRHHHHHHQLHHPVHYHRRHHIFCHHRHHHHHCHVLKHVEVIIAYMGTMDSVEADLEHCDVFLPDVEHFICDECGDWWPASHAWLRWRDWSNLRNGWSDTKWSCIVCQAEWNHKQNGTHRAHGDPSFECKELHLTRSGAVVSPFDVVEDVVERPGIRSIGHPSFRVETWKFKRVIPIDHRKCVSCDIVFVVDALPYTSNICETCKSVSPWQVGL